MSWMACANCGREIRHVYEGDRDGWRHTVEPIGHTAVPSKDATIGRARAIEDIRRQMEFEVARGHTPDLAWFRDWLAFLGQPSSITTEDEDRAAYHAALVQP